MILTRWINGTMPTFGYFHAHYLFSSALILAMSSFVPVGNASDMSGFDSALDLLRSMTENGNLAAAEFYHNLEQVKVCLNGYRGGRSGESEVSVQPVASVPAPVSGSGLGSTLPVMPESHELMGGGGQGMEYAVQRETMVGYTTEMAFLEPTMQDFLAQSDIDLGLLHPVDTFLNEAENLYTSHEL
ncbi:hypothetical protein N7526_003203 [Penicillium atrosanguineum]|nr:hypothetical protein N7526_003203 [Penicillium atrosanguineum]